MKLVQHNDHSISTVDIDGLVRQLQGASSRSVSIFAFLVCLWVINAFIIVVRNHEIN